jgi:5-methylcytosine-specific restriction endonuclease McrA
VDVLSSNVLVLNRCYQPINITSVRRAFSLLYQGIAKAIDHEYRTFDFESWADLSDQVHHGSFIHTVSRTIRIPRVIILQVFDKMPHQRIRFSRQNIYLRDNSTCQYCGQTKARVDLNLDHVVPKSQGGKSTWENIVCSCIKCNLKKGGRTPKEAHMKLLKPPRQPKWNPFSGPVSRDPDAYEAWRPFLNLTDAAYWSIELVDD